MNKIVGIIGCGWLGLPLAKELLNSGYRVKGTTTSNGKMDTLKREGIEGFHINLNEDGITGQIQNFLEGLHILIINVPPGLRGDNPENYVSKMKSLLKEIQKASVKHIVFVSSTSVYGNVEGEITEAVAPRPISESGKQLLRSEKLFSEVKTLNTAIIRFGGLIGEDRHPIHHLAGKSGLKNGEELVNLIHRKDCIHIIKTILEKNYWNSVFNGVYPLHPSKKEYYTNEAIKRGLLKPIFEKSAEKIVKRCIVCKNFLNNNNFLYTSIIS